MERFSALEKKHIEFIKTLTNWSAKKGREGTEQYWQDNNTLSLDGKATDIARDTD